mmetsp:Transcript_39831/g.52149  ORF Transcript_39831/g.52149 Transcript_39831/m.52149 type:complete len:101 (+) Transcript_39831:120-422(+)
MAFALIGAVKKEATTIQFSALRDMAGILIGANSICFCQTKPWNLEQNFKHGQPFKAQNKKATNTSFPTKKKERRSLLEHSSSLMHRVLEAYLQQSKAAYS